MQELNLTGGVSNNTHILKCLLELLLTGTNELQGKVTVSLKSRLVGSAIDFS